MTDRQEYDRALHHLVEAVSDYAIYMLDADGRVITWNTGAERLKGYGREEILGQGFARFFTLEDREAGVPASLLDRARRDGKVETQGWRVRKDGSRFWSMGVLHPVRDEAGLLIGFAKVTRDMTAQRAAEEQLADSERQFRLLVSGVVDYALYMLDINGIVSSWNAGAQQIKGYLAEEIVGQHFSHFYTEADRAAAIPTKALLTAATQGRYEAEGFRVRKDGSLFWASVVIDAIKDEAGQLVGFAKITRDITEKRNAQLELQRAQSQLAQAQKMEALGKLTGGVAHDFNNLLMVVSGQAQLLRKRVEGDDRALRSLDAIEASTRRGEDLTRHLLSFARRQRLRPESVALADRARSLRELLGASLPPSVQLDLTFPQELWPVEVDLSELELAILNLSVNARDAMPAGGRLTISAENRSVRAGEVEDLRGEFVAITVADSGVGIPADILPRVFDPFFTTKDVSKGTGLGLSQVYGFADQSGGRITVRSELGQGSSFSLYLPRANAMPVQAAEEASPPHVTGARILVVEDNPEVAEVAAGLLEQLGHQVRVVGNGAAALAVLAEGDRIDLVFSDVVMAGEMDGVDLARRLREILPGLPVLLATGYSQAVERLGDEFPILRKPYKLPELNRAVSALLASPADPGDGKLVALEAARRARAERSRGRT